MSRIASNLFALQILGVHGDEAFVNVLVRTVHPVSERPVAGVSVTAKFGDARTATGTTTAEGTLRLRIPMAETIDSDEDRVEVSARVGDFVQEGQESVEVERLDRMLVQTDKQIYQPGQTIRMRGLARRANGAVLANVPVRATIYQDRNRLYQADVRTTRFGVWAADWTVPEAAVTGRYSVAAEVTGMSGVSGSRSVTVSRYELPNFSVRARLERTWYLAGQQAVIHVSAQYLFGRPVEGGEVIVKEAAGARTPIFQGRLEQGTARVAVRPRTTVENVQEWFDIDVKDAAGKTERTQIAVRWAKEPLSVEVLGVERLSSRVVVPLYVRVRYADGTPAPGAAWYLPWTMTDPVERPVSLQVSYDKAAVRVGDSILCTVEARRKTLDGRGLLIAEVGLPPGVEVERSSLPARAEVEPDRVVFYLWPRGMEPVAVQFRFRVRFAMKAKAAPSALWDYYNPEARAEAAPEVFRVEGGVRRGLPAE
ncbi:MAG: hypothetical protein IT168_04090 [Bryobacterales bacterium]|nr:hypothetical protein [Bryobacterales bacterium]